LSFPTIFNPLRCGYDNATRIDISNPSERFNVVGGFTAQFNPDTEFFLQGLYVRNNFTFTSSPASVANMTLPDDERFLSARVFAQFIGSTANPQHPLAVVRAGAADGCNDVGTVEGRRRDARTFKGWTTTGRWRTAKAA
jgi:hypothetical protein